MWVLGFILLATIYIIIAKSICAAANRKSRKYLIAAFCFFPILLPLSFYFDSSYYQFKKLCDDTNRYEVAKIDIDYIPPFSGCEMGFGMMISKNYKGFECNSYQGIKNQYPHVWSLYRFTFNEKWKTEECQYQCFKGQPYAWEEKCLDICFNKSPISKSSDGIEYKTDFIDLIEGKIRKRESYAINEKSEVIAKALNYIYYPYGNGIATILGGASGEAPTFSCNIEYDIFNLDFLPSK